MGKGKKNQMDSIHSHVHYATHDTVLTHSHRKLHLVEDFEMLCLTPDFEPLRLTPDFKALLLTHIILTHS